MRPGDLVNLLSRSKFFIAQVIVTAIAGALLLTYVISEKYQASTVVLLHAQKSLDLVPKRSEILSLPVGFNTTIETGSTTYTEIIKSRAIAARVVAALRLDATDPGDAPGGWRQAAATAKKSLMKVWTFLKFGRIPQATRFDDAVEEATKSLTVKPTKDTYLFEIVAQARSPQKAADIANSAAAAFSQYVGNVSASDNASEAKQSSEKLGLSAQALEASRRRLSAFKQEHGIALLSKQAELEVEALAALERSVQTTTTTIAGLSARKSQLRTQIRETDQVARFSSTVIDNPLLRDLRLKLVNNRMKLARLNELYTDQHKEVAEILAENGQIEQTLSQAAPTIDSEQVTQLNPAYQSLTSELTKVDNDLVSLSAERERLLSEIAGKRAILGRLPSEEATLARLQLAVELNEETHKLLAKQNDERNASESQSGPTVELVHAATPSPYPVSPIKIYNVSLAAILGALTAIALVIVRGPLAESAPQITDTAGDIRLANSLGGREPVLHGNNHFE